MIYQPNVALSGIGDRLFDIILVSTLAVLYNTNLVSVWKNPPIENDEYSILRPKFRMFDCLYENLIKYISFPPNVAVISEEMVINTNKNDIIFEKYLGGSYSPYSFYDSYVKEIFEITIEQYIDIYFSQMNSIKFNIILNNIPDDLVTVHIRRTDKVCATAGTHNITYNELTELNEKTYCVIDKLINYGYTKISFCSDDSDALAAYINKYKNMIDIISFECTDQIEKTYYDLYVMSKSKVIVLSQRHSNFSLFASIINNSKQNLTNKFLIYLYNDDMIHQLYSKMNHLIYYENINKIKIL